MVIDVVFNQDCAIGLKALPTNVIDMVITSPPYDSLRSYNNSAVWNFNIFQAIATELYRTIKLGAVLVWIVGDKTYKGSESGTSFRQALYFKELGFLLHDTMIWQKISPFQHKNRYIQCFEYMFVFSKNDSPKTANLICDRRNKWAGTKVHGSERLPSGHTRPFSEKQTSKTIKEFGARYNIWNIPGEKANRTGHPAVFPERLVTDHILTWSNPGDLICDPFMGSGTTALAAKKTGRHYLGFEIDKKYFQICNSRIHAVS